MHNVCTINRSVTIFILIFDACISASKYTFWPIIDDEINITDEKMEIAMKLPILVSELEETAHMT